MPLRHRIAAQVRAPFLEPGSARPAVVPAPFDQRLLPVGSPAFDIHADVTVMMIGGIASLLLQMLHPRALAGVWDHSNFRQDMGGRLRRTAAFIAVTTFGPRAQAEAAIARVNAIHGRLGGTLPDGTPYRADEPETLAFVGVVEALAFLKAWRRYRDPLMPPARQDRYVADMGSIARRLGANPVPETKAGAEALLRAFRPELRVDSRTREVCRLLLSAPPPAPALAPAHRLIVEAAIDLLPPWARGLHGLRSAGPATPLLRASATGLGAMVRWVLAAPRQPRESAA
ncbi:oxygenase MpaB family protein [Thermaurantiacus sp.]